MPPQVFRTIAVVEGVRPIILFLVAMPLKYLAGNVAIMPLAGWGHGIAFIAYMLALAPGLWGKGFSAWYGREPFWRPSSRSGPSSTIRC